MRDLESFKNKKNLKSKESLKSNKNLKSRESFKNIPVMAKSTGRFGPVVKRGTAQRGVKGRAIISREDRTKTRQQLGKLRDLLISQNQNSFIEGFVFSDLGFGHCVAA